MVYYLFPSADLVYCFHLKSVSVSQSVTLSEGIALSYLLNLSYFCVRFLLYFHMNSMSLGKLFVYGRSCLNLVTGAKLGRLGIETYNKEEETQFSSCN